ncbi:Y4yA family PLP-dependent enzyme [Trinickia terrae]|uniref:Y4yA family PLP-dependent enzyme n=1 Tax=Trinickia terrae TaxID=2571161 RepID=A0A4U1I8V0_9BURK|nr:alanine racemase [Trinickia terrae]TKC89715.1 Y4yA family PLP-dependent enzyme [Trinickia terrae]
MVNDFPRLPALWQPALRGFVDGHAGLIRELAHGFDAPLHFVFPERFAGNVAAFQRVLDARGIAGRIFYAKKANKARCFVRVCGDAGIGVDVASAGEFAAALAAGVRGADVGVSGPAKADELLRLSVLHDALLAIDSADELARLAALARSRKRTARVLLRMLPAGQAGSRFGLSGEALGAALAFCAEHRAHLRLEGFSFHLSGYSAQARCSQAGLAVRACATARSLGLAPHTIDIGGGFAMSYAGENDWGAFLAAHRPHDYHAHKTFEGFYPYHQTPSGPAMLDAILGGVPDGETQPLADLLNAQQLQLMLEPGRALLDQAGFTVFTVQGVKDAADAKDPDGYGIVTANGTSFSVSEQWFGSEFLPDPELLPAARDSRSAPYRACVGGASCLDSDMLTWRKVAFPQRPEAGDLLLYPNTAGYQMDSNESPFHELPLPPKIAVTLDGARPSWRVDRFPPFPGA